MPDKLGRQVEWAYFGVRGEPADTAPGVSPFHRLRRILDEKRQRAGTGQHSERTGGRLRFWTMTGGRRCAKLIQHFDATNKQIGSECFDAAGNPTSTKSQ